MVRSRIFGIVWILMALFYYIASDSWLAAAILLVTVGFFLYLPVSVLSGAKLLKFRLSIQDEVIKNVPAGCRLLGKNLSLLPLAKAKVTVSFRNILTCSEESADFYMAASPRGSHEIFWDFKSLYAGKTEITVSEVTVYDFLGIFQKSFSGDTRHSIYVIPETFLSSVDISNRNAPNMDSDYYSDTRKGYDSGETFAIREYVPGDSTKFIHWKLSSKLDKVLVRELGFPIQNSILVLLETGWTDRQPSASAVDAMLEAFISLSHSLCDSGMEHHMCWYDHSQSRLFDYEVTDREGIQELMKEVLSSPASPDESSVISHYLDACRDCRYAHVVYITCSVLPDEVLHLSAGSCVTVLKCTSEDDAPEGAYLPSGISLIPFYGDTIRDDLCHLNL